MKLKIKVKVITKGCMPSINEKGDWIDLKSAVDVTLKAPQSGSLKRKTENGEQVSYRNVTMDTTYIPLGVAMKLPDGFEAVVNSRSSSPYKFKLFIPNGQGVIDGKLNIF